MARGREGGQSGGGGRNPGNNNNNHAHPGQGNQRQRNREQMIGKALSGIQNALIARGVDPGLAIQYAQRVLTRPGVAIGKGGIHYKGQKYKPEAFASSKLADFVTGLTAEHQNQAAIQGDAGYQTDLANLTLQQQLNTAGLDEQQRRAVLDFGSPAYSQDPTLAGEAAANPFSVQRLLAQQNAQTRAGVTASANRAGTLFGGGAQSGQAQAQQQYAGAETDATQKLVDLLAGLAQQRAQAGSIFQTGQQTALQAATQRLMESGVIHAAHAPHFSIGTYNVYHPPHHSQGVPGSGGLSGAPPGNAFDPTRPPRPPRPPRNMGLMA